MVDKFILAVASIGVLVCTLVLSSCTNEYQLIGSRIYPCSRERVMQFTDSLLAIDAYHTPGGLTKVVLEDEKNYIIQFVPKRTLGDSVFIFYGGGGDIIISKDSCIIVAAHSWQ